MNSATPAAREPPQMQRLGAAPTSRTYVPRRCCLRCSIHGGFVGQPAAPMAPRTHDRTPRLLNNATSNAALRPNRIVSLVVAPSLVCRVGTPCLERVLLTALSRRMFSSLVGFTPSEHCRCSHKHHPDDHNCYEAPAAATAPRSAIAARHHTNQVIALRLCQYALRLSSGKHHAPRHAPCEGPGRKLRRPRQVCVQELSPLEGGLLPIVKLGVVRVVQEQEGGPSRRQARVCRTWAV